MSDFFVKICTNGHSIIERHPLKSTEYCEKCGAELISKCPNCNSAIKEWHINAVVTYTPEFEKPSYCRSCGKPYPWTSAAIEATALMIQEDAELSELERQNLEASLPDIIVETPKTKLATIRIQKALLTCSKFTAEAIRQFAIDFGCELAKSSLGL